MHSTLFRPCLRVARPGCVFFLFCFCSLATYPAAASRPSSWHYQPLRQGLGPWRAELNNVTHVAFFFSILIFLGVPQNGNRGLTYCVTQKQVPEQGNGPWKVSATILVFCIPLVFLPSNPHCWGAMSRKTSNGEQRLDMMCLKGASGTPHAIKHSCDSTDAVEQPIVATCILAGVTVMIRGTAWMEVRFGPIPVCCRPKGGTGSWSVTAVNPISCETCRSAIVVFCWGLMKPENLSHSS